jgi:hypothetical protein
VNELFISQSHLPTCTAVVGPSLVIEYKRKANNCYSYLFVSFIAKIREEKEDNE